MEAAWREWKATEEQLRRSERRPYVLSIGPNYGSVKGIGSFVKGERLSGDTLQSRVENDTLNH